MLIRLGIELEKAVRVLLSAKLCRLAFLIKRKRSWIYTLNKIGPRTDPCGTPERTN